MSDNSKFEKLSESLFQEELSPEFMKQTKGGDDYTIDCSRTTNGMDWYVLDE